MQVIVSLAALLAQGTTLEQIIDEPWIWVDHQHGFLCSNLEDSEGFVPPQARALIEPVYPRTYSPIVGRCIVGFDVTPQGLPEQITPTDCPNPRTVRSSVRAVERLRFEPARSGGDTVRCEDSQITYIWAPGVGRLDEVETIALLDAPLALLGGQPCNEDTEQREVEPPRLLSLPQLAPYPVDISDEGRCVISLDVDAEGAPLNISEPDCIVPGLRDAIRQGVFIPAIQGPAPIAWCGGRLEYDLTRGD